MARTSKLKNFTSIWKQLSASNLEQLVGPDKIISKLEIFEAVLVNGVRIYEANAFLADDLLIKGIAPKSIYSGADGSGSGSTKSLAAVKAASEAIERWAFFGTYLSEISSTYGFDKDCSTTGMASFPSIFKSAARNRAYCEAAERWSIQEWWNGNLGFGEIDPALLPRNCRGIQIKAPIGKIKCVILFMKVEEPFEFAVYGFAAKNSITDAIAQAHVELSRNYRCLSATFKNKKQIKPSTIEEQRLLYFATMQGHSDFIGQLDRSRDLDCQVKPKIIVDTEIQGPWTRYSCVYRVLFEQSKWDDLSTEKHFLF